MLSVIGIPKTIDNDLAETDHSPGYGSAARFAAVAAAEIGADASALPIHIVVMEVMGRNAGWLTAAAGLGAAVSGCEMMTLLPEQPLDTKAFLQEAERRYRRGHGLLVAVSEGVCGLDGKPIADSGIVDGFGHKVPGRARRSGCPTSSCRSCRSSPVRKSRACSAARAWRTFPRPTGARRTAWAGCAVLSALEGRTGSMIAIRAERKNGYAAQLIEVPLEKVANTEKKFPTEWMERFAVSDAFADYCLPLLGGALPAFAHLR